MRKTQHIRYQYLAMKEQMDSLAKNIGEDNTGGCNAIQRPKNSESERPKQASIEMNTADIETVYSIESRRSERTYPP